MLRFLRNTLIGFGLLLVSAVAGTLGSDPFDKFQVLDVLSDPPTAQHAVTYRYRHADSSSEVFAVWILSNAPPIGSQERVRWQSPVIVWQAAANAPALRWANGRLHAVVPSGSKTSPSDSDCYFEYDQNDLVCADRASVELESN